MNAFRQGWEWLAAPLRTYTRMPSASIDAVVDVSEDKMRPVIDADLVIDSAKAVTARSPVGNQASSVTEPWHVKKYGRLRQRPVAEHAAALLEWMQSDGSYIGEISAAELFATAKC